MKQIKLENKILAYMYKENKINKRNQFNREEFIELFPKESHETIDVALIELGQEGLIYCLSADSEAYYIEITRETKKYVEENHGIFKPILKTVFKIATEFF